MAYVRCMAGGNLLIKDGMFTLHYKWLYDNHHRLFSSIVKPNNRNKPVRNDSVRVTRPTRKDGWQKRLRYTLYMNSYAYKSYLSGVLLLTVFLGGIGLFIRYMVEEVKANKSIKLAKDELRYVDERDIPDVKLATPYSQIQISEERGCVFVSYFFLSSWRVSRFELRKCLFDEEGNIVLDKVGFPLLWDQPISWLPRSLR